MIFTRRGIDIERYPSVLAHLSRFRHRLEPRPADWRGDSRSWPGRKPGTYRWYEIQDAIEYFELLRHPKIVYNDITWNAQFCIDNAVHYINNTAYLLPSDNSWIVAVLNAPIGWWFAWRSAQHSKDEALRYFNTFVEDYPVPPESAVRSEHVRSEVRALIEIQRAAATTRSVLADWYRAEHGVERPSKALADPFKLDADAFVAELRRSRDARGPLITPAGIAAVHDAWRETVAPIRERLRRPSGWNASCPTW